MSALTSKIVVIALGLHRWLTWVPHEPVPYSATSSESRSCLSVLKCETQPPLELKGQPGFQPKWVWGVTPRKCSWMIISFLITTLSSFQVSSFKCISSKINYFYLFLLLLPVILLALTGEACSINRMMSAFVHIFFLSEICTAPLCHKADSSAGKYSHKTVWPPRSVWSPKFRSVACPKKQLKPQRANLTFSLLLAENCWLLQGH